MGANQGGLELLRPNILQACHQKLPLICPYKRAGVQAGIYWYNSVGVWAVKEPGISGPIRPSNLAPRCPAICPYKWVCVWVVMELGISGPIRTGTLAPKTHGICLYTCHNCYRVHMFKGDATKMLK